MNPIHAALRDALSSGYSVKFFSDERGKVVLDVIDRDGKAIGKQFHDFATEESLVAEWITILVKKHSE